MLHWGMETVRAACWESMSRSKHSPAVRRDDPKGTRSPVALPPTVDRSLAPRPFRASRLLLALASGLLAVWLAFLAFLALLSHK